MESVIHLVANVLDMTPVDTIVMGGTISEEAQILQLMADIENLNRRNKFVPGDNEILCIRHLRKALTVTIIK
jgi:hypothetical protein